MPTEDSTTTRDFRQLASSDKIPSAVGTSNMFTGLFVVSLPSEISQFCLSHPLFLLLTSFHQNDFPRLLQITRDLVDDCLAAVVPAVKNTPEFVTIPDVTWENVGGLEGTRTQLHNRFMVISFAPFIGFYLCPRGKCTPNKRPHGLLLTVVIMSMRGLCYVIRVI